MWVIPVLFQVMQLSDAPLEGRLLALPTKMSLGLTGLPGTNTIEQYMVMYMVKIRGNFL